MRRRVVPALLAFVLLAGCLGVSDAPRAPLAAAGEASGVPLVGVRALVDGDAALWEPMLGVTREGVLFSGSFGRAGDGSARGAVYRSVDGGRAWEHLGDPAAAPAGIADPHLAVDADGAVWFSALWVGCVAVAVSRDGGDSWASHPAACAGAVGDRQTLVPTRGGHAVLDWQQFPTKWHVASRTDDHGRSWRPAAVAEPPGAWPLMTGVSGWGGSGVWDPVSGAILVTFSWFTPRGPGGGYDWSPAFSVSPDGGDSWTLHRLDERPGRYHGVSPVVAAADDAGNLYLAWAETGAEGDTSVHLAVSRGDPRVWHGPYRVDAPGGSKVMPTLAAGARGEVALAWLEADEPGHPGEVGDDAAWRVRLAWSRDALAPAPTFGRAWLDGTVAARGPVCMDGVSCSEGRSLGEYFSLKRLPDGRVGALWASTEETEARDATLVYAATAEPLLAPWP